MPDPIRLNTRILLAKLETTYGTDAAPSGAANAVLATEVVWTPMEGNDVSRDLVTPWLGAQPTIPTELHAKLTFKVELAPSGTAGTAPAWGPLLRACGLAETIVASTSVKYTPVSEAHESATLHFYIGSTRYVMTGARGNVKVMVNAQGIVYLEFALTGLYSTPSEQSRPTAQLNAWKKPQLATKANTPTFTLNSVALVARSFSLDLGNAVETRFLIGSEAVIISDRSDAVEMTVEAVPLSTIDPFALAAAQTAVPVTLVHGTGAGKIATIFIPTMQLQRPQAMTAAQGIVEWALRGVPLPTAGNDQWGLTLT